MKEKSFVGQIKKYVSPYFMYISREKSFVRFKKYEVKKGQFLSDLTWNCPYIYIYMYIRVVLIFRLSNSFRLTPQNVSNPQKNNPCQISGRSDNGNPCPRRVPCIKLSTLSTLVFKVYFPQRSA